MENGIFFSIVSIFYLFLILILFVRKDKIKTRENTIYFWLIIFNLMGLLIEVVPSSLVLREIIPASEFVKIALLKLILIFMLLWSIAFSFYTVSISAQSEKRKKTWYYGLIFYGIFSAICTCLLDISYYAENRVAYSYGLSVDFVFGSTMFLYFLCMISLFVNYRRVKFKKFVPLLIMLPFGIIVLIIQALNRGLTLVYSLQAFITVLMFFTLENPDLKLLSTMKNARDFAEKNSKAKTDFLSGVSYEIRTPLNAIVGLSEDNLNHKDSLPSDVVDNCNDIVNASRSLLEILNNVIDINKIETGSMEVLDTAYNFKKEMNNLESYYKGKMKNEVALNFDIDDNIPFELVGDRDKVRNIIDNLLSNAIKYTDKGTVTLSVKCTNDLEKNVSNIVINCKDTGKGIKAELQGKLFTKFERLDDEEENTTTGAGLGLAVTKALTEMMGGSITVHSMYGEGTEFIVDLPQRISKLTSDSERIVHVQSVSIDESNNNLYQGKRILLVDDNVLNIKVSRKTLDGFGFIIEECHDGNECINLIKNGNRYDLIFMDIMMSNMTGDSTLHKLKEDVNFDIPVIALTADAETGAREKYLFVGFDEYLAKPFTREQIKEKIDLVFSKKSDVGVTDWDNAPSFTIDGDKTTFSNIDQGDKYDESYLLSNGINYKKTLALLGDMTLYRKELKKWYQESRENFDRLKTFKLDSDLSDFEECIHILVLDAKYYGFDKLYDLALEHEEKTKESNLEFINNNFGSLENEHIRIVRIVEKYLK